jgi:MFS family permease
MIYQFEIFKNLSYTERKTFRLHLLYSMIEGLVLGVIALNEFVFVKSLQGTDVLLSLLFSFSVVVLLFSLFLNEFLKRYSNKRKLLIAVALVTRLPMLALLFFPDHFVSEDQMLIYHALFLIIFLFYFSAQPVILPIINLYLKNNYSHENFGKLYSYSAMLNKLLMLLITFGFGILLDFDYFAFRYVYPLIGILGILSIIILASIRTDHIEIRSKSNLINSVRNSYREFIQIIKHNKAYRDFEIGFMLYGIAFMSTAVLIPLFYNEILALNYTSMGFYKNFYNIIAIATLPLFGRLLGGIDPRKFAVYTFSFMLISIILTALTEYFTWNIQLWGIQFYLVLMLANICYGLFAASMPLLWNIGSAYFCEKGEVATYQSIHLSLTGLRGIFAPLSAVVILSLSNYSITFAFAVLFLLLGIGMMLFSLRRSYSKN